MPINTKPARRLPPALAKRASALVKDKKARLAARGRSLLALVRDKRRVIAAAFYEMGQALVVLSDAAMFGALGHATFDDLLEHELEMSLSQADRLMAAARRLDEEQAADLGYEKSLAVASALALPGTKLSGSALLLGERTLDTGRISAAAIDQAATALRHSRQRPGRPGRGKTTTPRERADAARCQAELRRAGAKGATVHPIATKPGQPADLEIRLRSTEVAALGKVGWGRRFIPKG